MMNKGDKEMKRYLQIALLTLFMLAVAKVSYTQGGMLMGDEALGGFSYMMECAYKNELPKEPYLRLYYQAYMMFHYDYIIADEEKEILFRIVEAEATGGTITQKMNVASCIIARMESKSWPDTIKGVVFQHNNGVWQFTPLGDGRYYTVAITDSTRHAVDRVLKWGKTHNYLWFCSDESYNSGHSWHRKNLVYDGFFDGEHHYFY